MTTIFDKDCLLVNYEKPNKENDVCFLTFGGPTLNYLTRVIKICEQAYELNFFTKIYGFSDHFLINDKEFWSNHGNFIENNNKGYGYWLWKPHIIHKTIYNLKDNDILIYADAGCFLNSQGMQRLVEYTDMVKNSEFGVLVFQMKHLAEKMYTKKETLDYFNADLETLDSGQIVGGIIILRKCKHSLKIINEWKEITANYNLINDKRDPTIQFKEFIDHRNDQSVFSLLIKKHGAVILNDETYFYPNWMEDGEKYPIWATRIKEKT
jgi:hypothetical protein